MTDYNCTLNLPSATHLDPRRHKTSLPWLAHLLCRLPSSDTGPTLWRCKSRAHSTSPESHYRKLTTSSPPHSYLDLLCPFSKKITLALNERLVPALLDNTSEISKSLTLFIRPYPQPWHPHGSYLIESVLAFGRSSALNGTGNAAERKRVWWAFFVKLMQEQERWFNGPVKDKTAEQVRDELASLAGDVLQAEDAIKGPASKAVGEIRDLIALKPDSPNSG